MSLKLRALSTLLRALALCPLSTQRWLGRRLGDLMWHYDKRSVRVSRANIALCFPELDPAAQHTLCRASLRHTGMAFAELGTTYFWPAHTLASTVSCDDHPALEQALSEGKGVILASPHFGNWEMTGQYLSQHHTMHVLYRPAKHPQTDAFILNRRSRFGTTLQPTDARGVRGLSKALKENAVVGILPDQEPELDGGVFAPFFGHSALTMTLLNKLANRKRVPVMLTYMRRTPTGFQCHLHRLTDDIYNEDLKAATTALNHAIETLVRHHPEQYIWNYKRFATREPGHPNIY